MAARPRRRTACWVREPPVDRRPLPQPGGCAGALAARRALHGPWYCDAADALDCGRGARCGRLSLRPPMTGVGDLLSGWPPPVLDPAGPFAGPIATVAWVLFAMSGLVLTLVLVATGIALFGPRRLRTRLGGERLVLVGGFAF